MTRLARSVSDRRPAWQLLVCWLLGTILLASPFAAEEPQTAAELLAILEGRNGNEAPTGRERNEVLERFIEARRAFGFAIYRDHDLVRIRRELDAGLDLSREELQTFLQHTACSGTDEIIELVFSTLEVEPDAKGIRRLKDRQTSDEIINCLGRRKVDMERVRTVVSSLTPWGWTPEEAERLLELGEIRFIRGNPVDAMARRHRWNLTREFGANVNWLGRKQADWVDDALESEDWVGALRRLEESKELMQEHLDQLLETAAKKGRLEAVSALIRRGARPAPDLLDSLASTGGGKAHWIEPMLEAGAPASDFVYRLFQQGRDSMVWAIVAKYIRIDSAEDPAAMDEQERALTLLEAGVDPWFYSNADRADAPDADKHSAHFLGRGLLEAAKRDDLRLVDLYLRAGASIEADGRQGAVLLREAAEIGRRELLARLRERGALDEIDEVDEVSKASQIYWDQMEWLPFELTDETREERLGVYWRVPGGFHETCRSDARWTVICDSDHDLLIRLGLRADPGEKWALRVTRFFTGIEAESPPATSARPAESDPERWVAESLRKSGYHYITVEAEGPSRYAREVEVLAREVAISVEVPGLPRLITPTVRWAIQAMIVGLLVMAIIGLKIVKKYSLF